MNAECNVEVYGNIWFKEMVFHEIGDVKEGHAHNYDHISFITNGTVELFKLSNDSFETMGEFIAGDKVRVPAGTVHKVISKSKGAIVYCMEATRKDGIVTTTNFNDPEWKEPLVNECDDILEK